MESNSDNELRKKLADTEKRLHDEKLLREYEQQQAEIKREARESKAADNTALIVLFGGIALIFILAFFGIS